MITQEELQECGWKKVGAMSNGGTTLWQYGKYHVLEYGGTNMIHERNNDYRELEKCVIKKVQSDLTLNEVMNCQIEDKRDLLQQMDWLGIKTYIDAQEDTGAEKGSE